MEGFYSAANSAVTTISNCADEPIQIPGTIQPYGFLLAIHRKSGLLSLCSENVANFLGNGPAHYLSRPYTEVLPAGLLDYISDGLVKDGADPHAPTTISIQGVPVDCFTRFSGDFLLLEGMPADQLHESLYDVLLETDDLIKQSGKLQNLQDLCSVVAEKLRRVIGFDRVMVYRFDADYNGHVFAESVAPGIDSFLDLHYPHTDIPAQARKLYLTNRFRIIPDIGYTPVPLITHDKDLARPELFDLSDVFIRSVSPIHIQYLQNMGVQASFSISLIKDGQLWGLIACHHYQPRLLTYTMQMQACLLSQLLSSQIAVQETAEQYARSQHFQKPLNATMQLLEREENFIETHFVSMPEIPALAGAQGAALIFKGALFCNGVTPPAGFIMKVHEHFEHLSSDYFSTDELQQHMPDAAQYADIASGLLWHRLNSSGAPALLWFRPSANRVVNWAGNPSDQQNRSPLTPRHSFEAWQELKQGISDPWQKPELDAAFHFSYLLQQHIFYLHQLEEEIKYRRLNEKLVKANKELQNINWISTHDLKEPLRKIQVFASMMAGEEGKVNFNQMKLSVERIKSAASRMQRFIDDLMLYAKVSDTELVYEPLNLNLVIKDVLQEFEEEKSQGHFDISMNHLPVIRASAFQFRQLFQNLIGNAIKFRKPNEKQVITVMAGQGVAQEDWFTITISDQGIGFRNELRDAIFDIFKRGHTADTAAGTGVGLSICRKIVENYGGKITAMGEEGKGAIFTLQFPRSLVLPN